MVIIVYLYISDINLYVLLSRYRMYACFGVKNIMFNFVFSSHLNLFSIYLEEKGVMTFVHENEITD